MSYVTDTTSGRPAGVGATRPDTNARCANPWSSGRVIESSSLAVDMGYATIKPGIRVFTQHLTTRRRKEPSP